MKRDEIIKRIESINVVIATLSRYRNIIDRDVNRLIKKKEGLNKGIRIHNISHRLKSKSEGIPLNKIFG